MDKEIVAILAALGGIALWLWLAGRSTPEREAYFQQWVLDEWEKIKAERDRA